MAIRAAVLLAVCAIAAAELRIGAAKVNSTMPTGVPLAGYNHGPRRVPDWPIPKLGEYTTFMMPSTGHLDTTWAKALFIDTGSDRFCFVTIDAIGSDSTIRAMALTMAQARGLNLSDSNFALHGSHTHSGPGALSPNFLWAMAPATDLLVPEIQRLMSERVADAMIEAAANMQPASLGVGSGLLTNVTTNRRARISPYLKPDSIDPHLGIIRVDDLSGKPIATVWNFAIHGVCWGPEQMLSNADIMGGASDAIEALIGGVALFINADAGDVDPTGEVCDGKPNYKGAPIIAAKVKEVRDSIKPSPDAQVAGYSEVVHFGPTNMNLTFARFDNCTSGGPLDICTICRILKCDANLHLGPAWMEEDPTFGAFRFTVDGTSSLMVTMPGEPLTELGSEVRNATLALGFDTILLAGYSNAHMGYFATADEYDIGGYESQLTLWGVGTADMVKAGCMRVAARVLPPHTP
eukprot:m.241238 g.241238  ORF g.241238 m.241238 type:complete len:464 (+) comp13811_c0_seq1:57-1448(+)